MIIMGSDETFNWSDGDVILRATHGTESRDFRVHKLFLSFSSPVFKDMFTIPQPPSAPSDGVDIVDVTDPPRALELILRFIYPSAVSPVIDDLTILSKALLLADKYDIEVARLRLRSSFKTFTETEPLRAYAIACRLGLEDEMKIASSTRRQSTCLASPNYLKISSSSLRRNIIASSSCIRGFAKKSRKSPIRLRVRHVRQYRHPGDRWLRTLHL